MLAVVLITLQYANIEMESCVMLGRHEVIRSVAIYRFKIPLLLLTHAHTLSCPPPQPLTSSTPHFLHPSHTLIYTQEHEHYLLSEGVSELPENHWGEDPSDNKTN